MNISEANHTNVVLRGLLDQYPDGLADVVAHNRLRKSAIQLADRAQRALHSGITGADVAARMVEYCASETVDENSAGHTATRHCVKPTGHDGMHDDLVIVWPAEGGAR